MEIINESKNVTLSYLKAVLALSPLFFIFGCCVLWLYLNELGRLDVFTRVIHQQSGLIAAVVSFLIVCIGVALVISFPSVILCQLLVICGRDNLRRAVKIKWIPLMAYASALVVSLYIGLLAFFDFWPGYVKEYSVLFLLLVLGLVSAIMTKCFSWKAPRLIFKNGQRVEIKHLSWYRLAVIIFVSITGLAIGSPFSFILNQLNVSTWTGMGLICILLLMVLMMSLLPALVIYLEAGSGKKIMHQVYSAISLSSLLLVFLFLISPGMFGNIYFSSLKSIGVASTEDNVYAISKNIFSSDMFPKSIWSTGVEENKNWFYINGVTLFSLGEVSLLCPSFVRDAKLRYMLHDAEKIMFKKNDMESKHLRSLARSCVIVEAAHARRWNTVRDGYNLLNR